MIKITETHVIMLVLIPLCYGFMQLERKIGNQPASFVLQKADGSVAVVKPLD